VELWTDAWVALLRSLFFFLLRHKVDSSSCVQTRTVARKSSIGGLYVCARDFTFVQEGLTSKVDKIPLIYSVSYFNLGGFELCLGELSEPKPPWRRYWSRHYLHTRTHLRVWLPKVRKVGRAFVFGRNDVQTRMLDVQTTSKHECFLHHAKNQICEVGLLTQFSIL